MEQVATCVCKPVCKQHIGRKGDCYFNQTQSQKMMVRKSAEFCKIPAVDEQEKEVILIQFFYQFYAN